MHFPASPPWYKFYLSRTAQRGPWISNHGKLCYCNDKNTWGKLVYTLSSFFLLCLFTLEMNPLNLPLASGWVLFIQDCGERVFPTYRRKELDRVSLPLLNLLYCWRPLFRSSDHLVSVFMFGFPMSLPMIITVMCAEMDAHASLKLLKSIF